MSDKVAGRVDKCLIMPALAPLQGKWADTVIGTAAAEADQLVNMFLKIIHLHK